MAGTLFDRQASVVPEICKNFRRHRVKIVSHHFDSKASLADRSPRPYLKTADIGIRAQLNFPIARPESDEQKFSDSYSVPSITVVACHQHCFTGVGATTRMALKGEQRTGGAFGT
ncbi:hypothetical protein E4U53_007106 [Claviceps sorghi]|nr:hypothetical protein E4U53_007106 [Claviceps sorghi]